MVFRWQPVAAALGCHRTTRPLSAKGKNAKDARKSREIDYASARRGRMACDAVGGTVEVVSQRCDRCERGSVQYCPTTALSRPTDWPPSPPSPLLPPATGLKGASRTKRNLGRLQAHRMTSDGKKTEWCSGPVEAFLPKHEPPIPPLKPSFRAFCGRVQAAGFSSGLRSVGRAGGPANPCPPSPVSLFHTTKKMPSLAGGGRASQSGQRNL